MEGPSLYFAAEQLAPFIGDKIEHVGGNTKIGKERMQGKKILSIFSHGKTLYFQFDTFAMRIHFLLYGSFEATVHGKKVTGDYPKKERPTRLSLHSKSGVIDMYSCSIKFVEEANAKDLCDFSMDVMNEQWDAKQAVAKAKEQLNSEISDVLLDQSIFMGVGNIIRNEVLLMAKVVPTRLVKEIPAVTLKKIIKLVRQYVFQFYEWRKIFELKKHYVVYRQSLCKQCGSKVVRKKTGARKRISFVCSHCQK